MSTKSISVSFGGVRFKFDLQSDFADYVAQDLRLNAVEFDRDNELRKLLNSYLKKSDEVYRLEKKVDDILQKLDDIQKN